MSGDSTVRSGRYAITKEIWFEIAQNDRGTFISLSDVRVDRRYTICIDENGVAVAGGVASLDGKLPTSLAAELPAVPEFVEQIQKKRDLNAELREACRDPLRCFPSSGRHKFTLKYSARSRPRHRAFPLSGYENDEATYIMYRLPKQHRGEALLKLIQPSLAIIEDDCDPDRLPYDEWARFLHLKAGATFSLNGRRWTKMSLAAIGSVVGGRVLRCVNQFDDLAE